MCIYVKYIYKTYGGGGVVAQLCPILVAPWTVAHQAPLSMGFLRQQYWSGLPFSFPRDLSDPGIEPVSLVLRQSPTSQANSLPTKLPGKPIVYTCLLNENMGPFIFLLFLKVVSYDTICDFLGMLLQLQLHVP